MIPSSHLMMHNTPHGHCRRRRRRCRMNRAHLKVGFYNDQHNTTTEEQEDDEEDKRSVCEAFKDLNQYNNSDDDDNNDNNNYNNNYGNNDGNNDDNAFSNTGISC